MQKTPADHYTASDITVSLKTPSTATSGIAYYEYWDGLDLNSNIGIKASGTTSNTYTINSAEVVYDRYGSVYYRAISNSGLASSWASIDYVIDKQIPTIKSVTGTSTTWTSSKTITIELNHSISGTKKYCYYVSDSATLLSNTEPTFCESSNTKFPSEITFTVTEPGKYIFFELINGAGASSGISSAYDLYIKSYEAGELVFVTSHDGTMHGNPSISSNGFVLGTYGDEWRLYLPSSGYSFNWSGSPNNASISFCTISDVCTELPYTLTTPDNGAPTYTGTYTTTDGGYIKMKFTGTTITLSDLKYNNQNVNIIYGE